MNKQRRKEIDDVIEQLEQLRDAVQTLYDEEEEYRDNIPENMQSGERYENADSACSSLDDALSSIDDALSSLGEARDV